MSNRVDPAVADRRADRKAVARTPTIAITSSRCTALLLVVLKEHSRSERPELSYPCLDRHLDVHADLEPSVEIAQRGRDPLQVASRPFHAEIAGLPDRAPAFPGRSLGWRKPVAGPLLIDQAEQLLAARATPRTSL